MKKRIVTSVSLSITLVGVIANCYANSNVHWISPNNPGGIGTQASPWDGSGTNFDYYMNGYVQAGSIVHNVAGLLIEYNIVGPSIAYYSTNNCSSVQFMCNQDTSGNPIWGPACW